MRPSTIVELRTLRQDAGRVLDKPITNRTPSPFVFAVIFGELVQEDVA
jgi:hypothetical protein